MIGQSRRLQALADEPAPPSKTAEAVECVGCICYDYELCEDLPGMHGCVALSSAVRCRGRNSCRQCTPFVATSSELLHVISDVCEQVGGVASTLFWDHPY